MMGLTAIDDAGRPTTIVFHLKQPFADFDYLAAIPQTAPVPPDKDTGANYQLRTSLSTGPYKFQSYQLTSSYTLVPQPAVEPADDPDGQAAASKIVVNMNINANDVDNRLLAGDVQVDFAGTGVQAAARAKILSNPTLKAQRRQPGHRARLVLLHQHPGGAAQQHRTAGRRSSTRPTRPSCRPPTAARSPAATSPPR